MLTNWIKQSNNKLLLLVLLLFFLKSISLFSGGQDPLRYTELGVLIAILILFIQMYPKIGILLKGFLLFALLGNVSGLFSFHIKGLPIDTISYSLAYLCLLCEAVYRIKRVKINFIIALYLAFVFAVNTYLIYVLYEIFKASILNNLELGLIVFRLVSLLLLALFSFTLYLSTETQQSILLLIMSISLIFSDVLFLIDSYYMYYWVFDILSKSLYLVTFYCLYFYISGLYKNKISPNFKDALS